MLRIFPRIAGARERGAIRFPSKNDSGEVIAGARERGAIGFPTESERSPYDKQGNTSNKAARPAGATRVASISEDCESAGGAEQSAFRRTIIWRKEDIGRDNEKKVFSFDDFDVSYFIFGSLSGNDFNGTSPVDFDKN